MYSLLLKNRIINSIILVVLLLLLRVILFVEPEALYSGPSGFLFQLWFEEGAPIGSWIWVSLLLIIQLYVLLLLCLSLKISSESTLVPGLTYVLLVAFIPDFGVFQPIIFANTFLLLALYNIFSVSPRKPSSKQIFNAGIFLAMATLFYSNYIFFSIAAVSGVNILRSYRFNDIKILMIGFVAPIFLFGVYFFWNDEIIQYSSSLFRGIGFPSLRNTVDYYHMGIMVILLLMVVSMILNNTKVMSKKTNIKQNYFKIIYWFLSSCLIATLFQQDLVVEHLAILAIPMALITSEFLINWKRFNTQLVINVLLTLIIVYQLRGFIL